MAKGKYFEQLVHNIQEALKDHPSTIVYLDRRLQSSTGQDRQFDVVIDTSVNGYDMRLAIECKDHGRKVESSAIEAFHTKCDLVTGIHRRIFVSNSGFQKGAIASANKLGIELHILEEVIGDVIIEWINTNEIYTYSFARKINKVHLLLVGEDDYSISMTNEEETGTVYYTDGQSSSYKDFLEWLLNNEEVQRNIKNLMLFQLPDIQAKGTMNEEHSIEFIRGLPKYAYFKVGDKEIFIKEVTFNLGMFITQKRTQPDIKVMRNPSDGNLKAGVLTLPYDKDGSKLQMVINPKSGKFKNFITNPDGSIKHVLKTLAKYNPKTQQYEEPGEDD